MFTSYRVIEVCILCSQAVFPIVSVVLARVCPLLVLFQLPEIMESHLSYKHTILDLKYFK